ncbi:MAG TPA: cytochrome c [Pirellulaceae bacterium]|nr:cytochrome c [Pirellulaceae bacterium]
MISSWFGLRLGTGTLMLGGLLLAGVAGCGSPVAQFKSNVVFVAVQENQQDAVKVGDRASQISDVLGAMFGTPDAPYVPELAEIDTKTVLDVNRLKMAAGPVGASTHLNPQGLYREHCAHCHGVTGDGMGPTAAFLNPYPRDYRPGKYKFKSTPVGARPTHADLTKTLMEGIPGTAMPSFRLLPADEVEALVQYVKYLSIRGEVERDLITTVATEMDAGAPLIDLTKKPELTEQLDLIKSKATTSFTAWANAGTEITAIPAKSASVDEDHEASIARGRLLFYTVAACNKCHGDSAQGDGQTNDYDVWTKELSPDKPELLKEYLELGALPPRNILPRNLRQGIYRGGRRPIDIYWRVMNGIEGTPMPGLKSNVLNEGDAPDPKKLTQDDVWHLINYVRSLPYDSISNPPEYDPNFQRDRN